MFCMVYCQCVCWVFGIVFQGWLQMGWNGNFIICYMFFWDCKGVLMVLFLILVYVLLLNYLVLVVFFVKGVMIILDGMFVVGSIWMQDLLVVNVVLFFNWLVQCVYFVGWFNGLLQGVLCLFRLVVNNFINFFLVCWVWKIFLIYCLIGKFIVWDKMQYMYLLNDVLGCMCCKLGEMFVKWEVFMQEQLDVVFVIQCQIGCWFG